MSIVSGDSALVRRVGEGINNQAFDLPRTFLVRSDEAGGSRIGLRMSGRCWPANACASSGAGAVPYSLRPIRFWCAGEVQDLSDGDTVLIPEVAPHTFKNTCAGIGQLLITLTPGNGDGFFIEVERKGLHPSRDMPQIVEIAGRYGLEFLGPPPG